MDLGTTTIVLRLLNLETGELIADASFENPAALRRLRRHVAHPLRHRASRQAADAHAGRLSDATPSRNFPSIRRRFTKWSSSAIRPCAICSSARTFIRSARTPIARSPKSKWPQGKRTTTSLTETGAEVPAADPSAGPRLRRADHQRPRRRRCRRLHAGGRPGPRGPAGRHHGHRHQHGTDSRQQASHPRRLLPGRAGVRRRRDLLRHAGVGRRDRRGGHQRTTARFSSA